MSQASSSKLHVKLALGVQDADKFWRDLAVTQSWDFAVSPKESRLERWYSLPVPRRDVGGVLAALRSMPDQVDHAYEDVPHAAKIDV